jgi:hypothetical protein
MDPVATIVAALVGGAVAGAKDSVAQVVKDGYAGLKGLVLRRVGHKPTVETAVKELESRPDSDGRRITLHEELTSAGAAQEAEVVQQAEAFLALLREHGFAAGAFYQAKLDGSGAIAQGPGSMAVGQRGVIAKGDVHGSIITGDGNVTG